MTKIFLNLFAFIVCTFIFNPRLNANSSIPDWGSTKHDPVSKIILITDGSKKLSLKVDYSLGCKITQVIVNGNNTISSSGVFTSIKTGLELFFSKKILTTPTLQINNQAIEIQNIVFGSGEIKIRERWIFTPKEDLSIPAASEVCQ
jgi:hypothetical protein